MFVFHPGPIFLVCRLLGGLVLLCLVSVSVSAQETADLPRQATEAALIASATAAVSVVAASPPQPLAHLDRCRVYVISIDGEVESALRHVIRRGLREAEQGAYDLVVLDMDTYGGQLFAAIEIAEALCDSPVLTATFVNSKAISAGALISFGTRYIGMVEDGMIGASTPMSVGGQEMPVSVEEKINSVVRAQFRRMAQRNGHPVEIAEAMVDRHKVVPGLVDETEVLTMTAQEALQWKVAVALAESIEEFVQRLGARQVEITRQQVSIYDRIARFLSQSAVAGVLMTVALLCLYIEARTPGIGLPGAIGLLCLLLFLFGNYLARLSSVMSLLLSLALILLGIVLLAVEVFVTPGFGVTGAMGIFSLLAGCLLSLLEVPVTSEFFSVHALVEPAVVTGSAFTAFIVLAALLMVVSPRVATATGFVLKTVAQPEQGYVATPASANILPGTYGRAVSFLRPTGMAELEGGQRVDVVTDGCFVPAGTRIRVVTVQGFRIVVEPVEE